ncbi:MAG: HAMP domain-containing histidine kinase [Bacteroidota bacterium]|nr:HAMP domain-containing histidine kinase [Bacteroidota bacterium]
MANLQSRYQNHLLKEINEKNAAKLQLQYVLFFVILLVLAFITLIAVLLLKSNKLSKKNFADLQEKSGLVSEHKKQLEELNKVKDKLFSIISHDFRGPLNRLKGILGLMQQGVIGPEEWPMLSASLQEDVNNTSDLLDNLLYWARNQLYGFHPNPIPLDIKDIIEDNIEVMQKQAVNKGISLRSEVRDSTMIYADPEIVKIVFRNLLTNAIKFSSLADEVVISTESTEKKVVVSVADKGRGIDPEKQKQLFKFGIHSTSGTANEVGTGLGLVLCREFIEKSGGEIWVQSDENKGSTFSFSLPLN